MIVVPANPMELSPPPVRRKRLPIIIGGWILTVLGLIEIVIGYFGSSIVVGGGLWWVGIFCVFTGIYAPTEQAGWRCMVHVSTFLCFVIVTVGALINESNLYIVKGLDACSSSVGVYGSTGFYGNMTLACRQDKDLTADCVCVNHLVKDSKDRVECLSYDLVSDRGNCLQVMGIYPTWLQHAAGILWFLVFYALAYCIYVCTQTCCSNDVVPIMSAQAVPMYYPASASAQVAHQPPLVHAVVTANVIPIHMPSSNPGSSTRTGAAESRASNRSSSEAETRNSSSGMDIESNAPVVESRRTTMSENNGGTTSSQSIPIAKACAY